MATSEQGITISTKSLSDRIHSVLPIKSVGKLERFSESKRSSNKKVRITTLLPYTAIAVIVIGILSVGYRPEQQNNMPLGSVGAVAETTSSSIEATNVDQVSAANIAASAAELANMSVGANVLNLAATLTIKSELGQLDENTTAKPQIVAKSDKHGVIAHTVVAGETASTIAQKYEVSADTVRWSNGLTSDTIDAGKVLTIPAIDGVLYTVKPGDTVATVAAKYGVDSARVVSYNDAEVQGIKAGQQIVVPGGLVPETERPGYVAPVVRSYVASVPSGTITSSNLNRAGASSGNRYAYGYCTWWVYEKRAAAGNPIGSLWGNATSWASSARSAGYRVDKSPEVGAVFQTTYGGGGYGHVGYITSVNRAEDGSVADFTITEMNYAGFNVVSTRTISASQIGSGVNFIH